MIRFIYVWLIYNAIFSDYTSDISMQFPAMTIGFLNDILISVYVTIVWSAVTCRESTAFCLKGVRENLFSGFPTRSDTNRAVQLYRGWLEA